MSRTFRDGCERMRVDADHPAPAHDPVNARHRRMQMTTRVFENTESPAGDGFEIDMLAPPTAPALKPRPSLLVPNHQNGVPVDQNIRCPSGKQAPPVVAP